jgi:CBS domain containing-hemolysin-like protein
MSFASMLASVGSAAHTAPANPWFGSLMAVLLVLLNGFFVCAEFAIVKVRPTQLEPHAAHAKTRARAARYLVKHLDACLSATQLGITLASLALGWVGEPAFAWLIRPLVTRLPGMSEQLLHSVSLTLAFAVITMLHIVIGELAPKSLAIRKTEPAVLWLAIPLYIFYRVTYPVIWLLNGAANVLLRIIGIQPAAEGQSSHSEAELRLLLSSSDAAHLSKQKRELLDNVFELSHRVARQVMVPRADVVFLSLNDPLRDNLERARASGYTRFPLCRDQLDELIGMVHIKDLFRTEKAPTSLEEVKRDIHFIPESLTLDRLLRRMRQDKAHIAAVVDEYGGVSGIVTLENVIEEIVGQIQDEFDREKPELVRRADNTYEISGSMLVVDLESALKVEFSDRNEDTIAGIVLSELGRSPRPGDRVEVGPLALEVKHVKNRRIRSLLVKMRADSAEPTS